MKPAIAQVCSLPAAFGQDLEDYAAGQCQAVEVWLTKLEDYLGSHCAADVRRLRDKLGVETPVASMQGGLLASQGDARREAWRLLCQRLALCQELEIGVLVLAADVPGPLTQSLVERVQFSLRQAADEAAAHSVHLALEFQANSVFLNNLQTAAAVVADIGHPHLGLCLDLFHFYVGPSKFEDLGYLTTENLLHVQLCDLADVPRELATDSLRILPGDGDIPLEPLFAQLRRIGYNRHVAVELMNPQLWQVPPRQFGEIALTALRKVLGQATM